MLLLRYVGLPRVKEEQSLQNFIFSYIFEVYSQCIKCIHPLGYLGYMQSTSLKNNWLTRKKWGLLKEILLDWPV